LETLYKIGELAAFFNISVRALRLYEKKGILMPAMSDPETGYRYYTIDQVHQLNSLLELKAIGFSLLEIKSLLNGKTDQDQLLKAMTKKQAAWQEAIAAAQHKIEAIDEMKARIKKSGQAGQLDQLTDEERAWLLVKLVCIENLRGQKELSEAIWL
jgi:DNA-binding transcriptional MerR regulator